jgi:hypothetical protein
VPEPGDPVHRRPPPRIGIRAKDSGAPTPFITPLG